jgi:hypothetical protein
MAAGAHLRRLSLRRSGELTPRCSGREDRLCHGTPVSTACTLSRSRKASGAMQKQPAEGRTSCIGVRTSPLWTPGTRLPPERTCRPLKPSCEWRWVVEPGELSALCKLLPSFPSAAASRKVGAALTSGSTTRDRVASRAVARTGLRAVVCQPAAAATIYESMQYR